MQEDVKKFSVRDNASGEYVVKYGSNFVEMGDKVDRIIFADESEAINLYSAINQFDDTLPEIIEEN